MARLTKLSGMALIAVLFVLVTVVVCESNSTATVANIDKISEVKTTAQKIFAIVRQHQDAGAAVAAGSPEQAQFEADLKLANANLTETKRRAGRHLADAGKIKEALLGLVSNVSHVELSHARLLGELVGEIAANAKAHFDKDLSSNGSDTGLENSFRNRQKEIENVVVPLGTALAQLLVERISELPPPVVHQEMENGIEAVIEQQNLHNESAHFAHMLANQIHLQEYAVCGHLILKGRIQPYDYLEAVGSGVGEVLAIMNDDDKRATPEMVVQSLEVQISARIRIALILAGVSHNESLDSEIALLAGEVANYTARDIVRLIDRSEVLDKARQELRMASAHYAKGLWNLRVIHLGSLVVLRTPPQLVSFTYEDDLASVIPPTWLRFDYVDLEPSLELYNKKNSASAGDSSRKSSAHNSTSA